MTQKPALKGNVLPITIAILLPLGFWLMGELKFFVPYDLILWRAYATPILGTSESWPSMCFPLRSFSSASFSSRKPDENSPRLRHLKSFRLLYIAPRATEFRRAEERFRSSVKQPLESDVSGEILRYLQIRRKWEKHEYVVPVTADFEFLNEARRRFHGERFESLYQAWFSGRIAERELRLEFSRLERTVFFDTYLVRNGRSPLDETHRRGVNGA